jgi:hypothetical protein
MGTGGADSNFQLSSDATYHLAARERWYYVVVFDAKYGSVFQISKVVIHTHSICYSKVPFFSRIYSGGFIGAEFERRSRALLQRSSIPRRTSHLF